MSMQKKRIAIFASGRGSNAARLIEHFAGSTHGEIALVCSNDAAAPVLALAQGHNIETFAFTKEALYNGNEVLEKLKSSGIHLVALAGFILKIPTAIVEAYPLAITNIHPALLPRHGGKGMYGINVHRAVIAAGDAYSGITIHLIDGAYDQGTKLFQARVKVDAGDTAETLAAKVLELEHRFYPKVVEGLCQL